MYEQCRKRLSYLYLKIYLVSRSIKDAFLGYLMIAVFEKTFMLLLGMKVHLLQKLRLNILKASSQTELKGPVDNLVLLNEFFNIYKEKEPALFTKPCF